MKNDFVANKFRVVVGGHLKCCDQVDVRAKVD